ncbi:hypothetical protein [Christiangramia crocea]|uniref:Uncharacterized protein n=1 Tax=Christiangramia crocea TaxID=2904124 RepID=A0A9X2A963_9FLAO|nr:hypothetical protein [Gramella crocea]MCG9972543.1 hypothetical protein [Gramella crocea]
MKTLRLVIFFVTALLFFNCEKEPIKGSTSKDSIAPISMSYVDLTNVREYSRITSGIPFVSANNETVYFEVVSVRNEEGILDETYLEHVTIMNPVEDTIVSEDYGDINFVDPGGAGTIIIEEGNNFGYGDYYFTVKATIKRDGKEYSNVFEDVLHLNIGPQLVSAINYCPVTYNLVEGEGLATSEATVASGNPDVRYELASDTDKLTIDPTTGVISLKPSYQVSETEKIEPSINVISNISEEVVTMESGIIRIFASKEAENVKTPTNYFFYPTLEETSTRFGYTRIVEERGGLKVTTNKKNKVWKRIKPTSLADSIRSDAGVNGTKALSTFNVDWGPKGSKRHVSWVIMNPQNLTTYAGCYRAEATFWIRNYGIEYLNDGRTPSGLEIFVTDNFTGEIETTNFTQINDILSCQINNEGEVFLGTPYPGNQEGPDPDGLKDPTRNADGEWVKCTLDLTPYLGQENFVLAFKYASYFQGKIIAGEDGFAGGHQISDVHYKANEL